MIQERIVNALATDASKSQIAKALHVSRNTVTAVAEQEWNKVEQRKGRIAAQAERNATHAAEFIAEKLEKENVPLSTLVPVFGVSVDKALALRSDFNQPLKIEHHHSGNMFHAFQRFHEDCIKDHQRQARRHRRTVHTAIGFANR